MMRPRPRANPRASRFSRQRTGEHRSLTAALRAEAPLAVLVAQSAHVDVDDIRLLRLGKPPTSLAECWRLAQLGTLATHYWPGLVWRENDEWWFALPLDRLSLGSTARPDLFVVVGLVALGGWLRSQAG